MLILFVTVIAPEEKKGTYTLPIGARYLYVFKHYLSDMPWASEAQTRALVARDDKPQTKSRELFAQHSEWPNCYLGRGMYETLT